MGKPVWWGELCGGGQAAAGLEGGGVSAQETIDLRDPPPRAAKGPEVGEEFSGSIRGLEAPGTWRDESLKLEDSDGEGEEARFERFKGIAWVPGERAVGQPQEKVALGKRLHDSRDRRRVETLAELLPELAVGWFHGGHSSMAYLTTEVRWFQSGFLPDGVRDWFQDIGEADFEGRPLRQRAPSRIDLYLNVPDGEALGVKIREGQVQVKRRERIIDCYAVRGVVPADVEQWAKWSFPVSSASEPAIRSDPRWLPVRKVRELLLFQLDSDSGCACELTELETSGREYWTLGFEAFGPRERQSEALFDALRRVFSSEPVPGFEGVKGMSYPGWLRGVPAGVRLADLSDRPADGPDG